MRELAAFLRQIAPNQLISDGGDGFDDNPEPYVGLTNFYAVRGDEGGSFSRLADIDALDMLSYHLYPRQLRLHDPARHRDLDRAPPGSATVTGKVAYLGECGYVAPDAERARTTTPGCATCSRCRGGQLGLIWQLSPAGRVNNDGYAVYSRRDNATAWILARWGKAIH